MIQFDILAPDRSMEDDLRNKIDNFTKPKGALGLLEELAMQIGLIQQSLTPCLTGQTLLMFAADHGITDERVSPSPKELTWQMIYNFLEGGAGINFLVRQHGFDFRIIDAGVDYDFPANLPVIDRKIRKSTRNYRYEAAMTDEEFETAIELGADSVEAVRKNGCNIIAFGEMGISNTSSSALWMHFLTGIPLDKCVGAGSGFYGKDLEHKYTVLKAAADNYRGNGSDLDLIRYFGGYEMVMTVGGMLKAAEQGMIILIDGFIMTACLLAATRINPNVIDYAVFGHQGDESGHKLLLDYLQAKPILHLGLRLGEGSGAVCAFPIVDSAVRMLNEMTSFKKGHVTKYF